jgi:hypothetical protein
MMMLEGVTFGPGEEIKALILCPLTLSEAVDTHRRLDDVL